MDEYVIDKAKAILRGLGIAESDESIGVVVDVLEQVYSDGFRDGLDAPRD
jgi:hypothetical protein